MSPSVEFVDELPELDSRITNGGAYHRRGAVTRANEIRRKPLDVIARLDPADSPVKRLGPIA